MSAQLHKLTTLFPVAEFIALYYPFSEEELLYLARNNYDFNPISENGNIRWSTSLVEKLKSKICWDTFSMNTGVPWAEIAPVFGKYINWNNASSSNDSFVWKKEYLEKYSAQIDWDWICHYDLGFDDELLFQFRDKWEWWRLSGNKFIHWTEDILENFAHRWDWSTLSYNSSIPFTNHLMKKFNDRWEFGLMSMNTRLVSDKNLPLLKQFAEIDYSLLSGAKQDFTLEFLEEYENKLEWTQLTSSEYLPWSLALIERFKNNWDFPELAGNSKIPWTLDFIEQYEDIWNWDCEGQHSTQTQCLSSNEGIPWSFDLIERYKNRLVWGKMILNNEDNFYDIKPGIASLRCLEWTVEKMVKYASLFDKQYIYRNPNFYKAIENEAGRENVFNLFLALS